MSAAPRVVLLAGALALVAAVGAAAVLLGAGPRARGAGWAGQPGAARSDTGHTRPTAMRRLVVSAAWSPASSRPGAAMRALRLSGLIPRSAVVGTVVSDDDCAPDSAGVSHCVNRIRLASGGILRVRHAHRMADVPCMDPGERLRVQAA